MSHAVTRGEALRIHPLREEVVEGLSGDPKILPTKLLYDRRGARLFDEITHLEEYYPTRTELGLLARHLPAVAQRLGAGVLVVEPGSGSGRKTRLLLEALASPAGYAPVDIAEDQLRSLVRGLQDERPDLQVWPLVTDYTRPFRLPPSARGARRTLVFFPGSTIGNFEPDEASAFLDRLGRVAGPEGTLLLGADLLKSRDILEPAYNDRSGVTAAFNLNVLRHLNRVLGTDFDLDRFRHAAPWDAVHSRIEMHLVSLWDQVVTIPGGKTGVSRIPVRRGEPIVTEHAYKYSPEALDRLVRKGGWTPARSWMDESRWFSLQLLEWSGEGPGV